MKKLAIAVAFVLALILAALLPNDTFDPRGTNAPSDAECWIGR